MLGYNLLAPRRALFQQIDPSRPPYSTPGIGDGVGPASWGDADASATPVGGEAPVLSNAPSLPNPTGLDARQPVFAEKFGAPQASDAPQAGVNLPAIGVQALRPKQGASELGPIANAAAASAGGSASATMPASSFDYDGLRKQLMGEVVEPSKLQRIMSIVGPALLAASGNQAGANAFIQDFAGRRREAEEYKQRVNLKLADMQADDYGRRQTAQNAFAAPFTLGRGRYRVNPETGATEEIYKAPEDYELYPEAMGYKPGTKEYFDAAEDYVLRANGPSAYDRDVSLDDHRTANDRSLEGTRQGNRVSLEKLRQANRVLTKQTPGVRAVGGSSPRSATPTATGPDGRKIKWNGSAWVPA